MLCSTTKKKDEIAIKAKRENAAEKRARECERRIRMGILRSNIQIEISTSSFLGVCVWQ